MIAVMVNALPFLWRGLLVSLEVSAVVIAVALVLGVLFGMALTYAPWWLRWPVRAYSDIVRGLPLITLIFFVYYGLPATGLNISGWWAATAALAAFETAHVSEVARGAFQSIHHGQTDAGRAIGLTFGQRMLYVMIPQALRRFLPPWINTVVDTVKGSAFLSLVGIVDLMLAVQQVIGRTFRPMPLYLLGALIYFAINYALSQVSRRLEARFAYVRE
jgi:polar amino acid transport system permease protein